MLRLIGNRINPAPGPIALAAAIATAVAFSFTIGARGAVAAPNDGSSAIGVAPFDKPARDADEGGKAPHISERQAAKALEDAEDALTGDAALDPTIALRDLAIALPALSGAERRRGERILARPTDPGDSDWFGPGDIVNPSTGEPYIQPVYTCTSNAINYSPVRPSKGSPPKQAGIFCIHWDKTFQPPPLADRNGNGIPDYVEEVARAAVRARAIENGQLKWRLPKPDSGYSGFNPTPGTDIYLVDLSFSGGIFGYAAPDPGQGHLARRQYGYIVIDENYSREEYPGYANPLLPMRVTIAHEYNHILHFNYDVLQDDWLFESSGTWMEEQVFPAIDDYVSYLPVFARFPDFPITAANARIYGAAVLVHWLSAKIGKQVVERAWANSTRTKPKDFAAGAYDRAIRQLSKSNFLKQFVAFAAASAEWRAIKAFPDRERYPDVKRSGRLRPREAGVLARRKATRLDHTAYKLYSVRKRRGRNVTLNVRAAKRTRSGIALVGRTGNATKGKVTIRRRILPRGGRGRVTLRKPRRFKRISAVVVNGDIRVKGFGKRDWNYTRDNRRYVLELR